jgi:hypothetical protein
VGLALRSVAVVLPSSRGLGGVDRTPSEIAKPWQKPRRRSPRARPRSLDNWRRIIATAIYLRGGRWTASPAGC